MIQYLLDTDIASYFLKKYDMALVARVRTALRANQVAISAVTRAELRYGQALLPAEAARRYALIDAFIAEGRGRLAPPGSRATTQWLENTRIASLSATYQAQHVVGGGANRPPLKRKNTRVKSLSRRMLRVCRGTGRGSRLASHSAELLGHPAVTGERVRVIRLGHIVFAPDIQTDLRVGAGFKPAPTSGYHVRRL